jgi:hypothetical protein
MSKNTLLLAKKTFEAKYYKTQKVSKAMEEFKICLFEESRFSRLASTK